LITAHHAGTNRLQLVLSSLDQAGLKSYRLQVAATELIDEAVANVQAKAQALLTPEQRAKLRQAHRREIQQVSQVSRKPPLSTIGMRPLHHQLENGDLLSVLELPEIQQSLAITDEQWERIEAAKKSAYPAARELILQAREFATPIFSNSFFNAPNLQPMIEQFSKETLSLLTEAQRTKFQELADTQKKRLEAAIKRNEIKDVNSLSQFSLVMPHGTMKQFQSHTKNGINQLEVTLHNAFGSPEVVEALELTESQQIEITRRLGEMHDRVVKLLTEQQQVSQKSDNVKRDKLRELVIAHNREYQKQLADLLTSGQNDQLKKECWKSLGWSALLQPEVAAQLQLTDEQKATIDAAIKTPAPQITPFTNSDDFEAFKKHYEKFHRKLSEHRAGIKKRVLTSLTQTQREQFEKLTGISSSLPNSK